ncbi:NAD(P)-binding domain-containing protein, partial [Pseudomonas citronellolis]|uniref:NAD(P)-binding domain-containing protein n=1 Tax=Pseudomonas citronellolis TaxID=53408 RepID=UPI0023E3CD4E
MKLGMIGLGRMGANMALRLLRGGHQVVGFDPKDAARAALAEQGAGTADSLAALLAQLPSPRVLWLMLPAGEITDATLEQLRPQLQAGDTLIEGGNAYYQDSVRRAASFVAQGVDYLDCGTSGGVWGLAEGYSLMIGGSEAAVQRLRPLFECLAPAA